MTTTIKAAGEMRLPEIRARKFDRSRDEGAEIGNLLSPQHQIALRDAATVLDYSRRGLTVFSEGEDAHFVYAVADGIVRISRHTDHGRRQVLALMMPGDLFGLPDCGIYLNTAEVACPTTLYRIPWQALQEMMTNDVAFQESLLVKVTYDFREAQRRIMILGQHNTYQRLASLLLDLAAHPSFFDAKTQTVTLPLTQADVGDYLGAAAETVARGFARLEREKLIARQSARQTRIIDRPGLQRLLERGRRVG